MDFVVRSHQVSSIALPVESEWCSRYMLLPPGFVLRALSARQTFQKLCSRQLIAYVGGIVVERLTSEPRTHGSSLGNEETTFSFWELIS